MSESTPVLKGLTAEQKRALLGRLLRERSAQGAAPPMRASFSQERMWLLNQLDPQGFAFNVECGVRLRGPLDQRALASALRAVVKRHDSLRTVFAMEQGFVVQGVLPEIEVVVLHRDLSNLGASEGERVEASRRLRAEERCELFDLARGPLVRAALHRLGADDHVFSLTVHHIVADGWSLFGPFFADLRAAYVAALAGDDGAPLPPLPIQYVDFARWQRSALQAENLDRLLGYWEKQLAGAPSLVDLPTDGPRATGAALAGGVVEAFVDGGSLERLKGVARSENATPYMVLLAALQAWLHRISGQDDLCVGTPIAGRTHPQSGPLIGFFVNMLVLRATFSENPTFRELVAQSRSTTLSAFAHQDLPFERLLEELKPARDLGRTPLFQVYLNMLNFQEPRADFGGLVAEMLPPCDYWANFDLTIYARERAGGLHFALVYRKDLFSGGRAEEMLAQFVSALRGLVSHPDRPIAEVSLMTGAAASRLPDHAAPLPAGLEDALPVAIAARAAATTRFGISTEGKWISGDDIQRRAGALSRRLLAAGLQRGEVVAVYAAREPRLVEAILGVLRAGGAFAILDPAYPGPRLALSVRAARPKGVLRVGLSDLPAELAVALAESKPRFDIAVPRADDTDMAAEPAVAASLNASDLAYVAFTSGTTGGVKAIAGTHGPLVHFFDWYSRTFPIGTKDRFTLLSGLSHDPLLRDVLAPLWVGGTLCIPDSGIIGDPAALCEWVARERITVMHLTPALGELLASAPPGTRLDALRYAFFGGETLTAGLVSRFRVLAPNAVCVNFYGATETPQAMGYHVVPEHGAGESGAVSLGRGIDDVQLLVLTGSGSLAGLGELGEIHVRTPHLSRGYLGDDELTSERFVVNPRTGDPADLLYRTGDLGRYELDGSVAFAGRRDGQVKLRGFRIELGEVEAELGSLPAVAQAAAALRTDTVGEKRLVGYVVRAAGGAASGEEIKAWLRERLPEYAVPSHIVTLERLPLTPNGKIDRRALPELAPEAEEVAAFEPPRPGTEEALAAIWGELLGRARVGRRDNFFVLGGHSLLAARVLSRVRARLGADIPLRALFEAPVLSDLAVRIDEGGRAMRLPPISRQPHGPEVPLSFAQLRLWLLHQIEPSTASLNVGGALRLRGPLDKNALQGALDAIAARHEPLRTTFVGADGEPLQHISAHGELPLLELPAPEGEQALAEALADSVAQPFDLSTGPLVRAVLYRRVDDDHVLLLCGHHIVTDGWSMGVFASELGALYDQLCSGRSPALPPLPVAYADYVRWQHGWLKGETFDNLLGYWRARLDGMAPLLALPADRPRPAIASQRGARISVLLPGELREGLGALARGEGATLFMVLLAAFKTLLSRYAGVADIVVGTPVAGRSMPELEGLIGFFVNTIVLRTDLSGEPDFGESLRRVRETCLGAYSHQELPFERLVEELRPERDQARNPLFQVMFVLQNAPSRPFVLHGLSLEPVEVERRASQLDLTLYTHEREDGIVATFEYASDLFDADRITRMAGHFEALLRSVVENPRARLADLQILTGVEATAVASWNATERSWLEGCVHELIQAQAGRTPDRTALVFEGTALDYGDLAGRVEEVACRLAGLGARPGSLVGVLLERSLEMVVGVLGVLKAGAAYVPLDPGFPPDRLAYMLEDSGAEILLTQTSLAGMFESKTKVVRIDALGAGDPRSQPLAASMDDLAYVIYTSGSTGKPKGVAITHRSLSNLLSSMKEEPGFSEDDVLLAVTTLSFDIAGLELYLPLLVGGRVVLASRDEVGDGRRLIERFQTSGASVMQATPATWRLMLESGWRGDKGLKVLCGGEALSRDLADELLDRVGEVWNVYGPTETTIWSSCERVRAERGPVSIGRPIANTTMYVLDGSGNLVPVGVAGELHIGGAGLARGYWNRPELTAERFIEDRVSGGGGRLYKTGDQARWLADGRLECLGRLDHQVKVRGYRIELEEIEVALRGHDGVEQAAVIVQGAAGLDQRLVAYITHGAGPPPNLTELQAHLRRTLPAYMVPSSFVFLDHLPLTPNGKVDRKALAALGQPAATPTTTAFVAPRTATEEIVAAIWGEVLGADRVSAEADFFDLGGHSLNAARVVMRIRKAFAVDLSLKDLFAHPTLASLARTVEARLPGSALPLAPPPCAYDWTEPRAPLSFTQQRLWFLDQLGGDAAENAIAGAVELRGSLDRNALESALSAIVERHESLRTTFAAVDGEPFQIIGPAAGWRPAHDDLSGAGEEVLRERMGAEARRRFDLEKGPVFRATVYRLAPDRHVLLVTMHHIVSDAWSLGVLVGELQTLYSRAVGAALPALKPLPLQYRDYARWHREHADAESLSAALERWKKRLAGAPQQIELPADRPRPAVESHRGATHAFVIEKDLVDRLHRLSRQQGTTLYMTLLAGLDTLLWRYTGQDDLVLGSPMANRPHPDLERLVGFFTNTVLIRTKLDGDPTFAELLARVRAATLDALSDDGLPFERLVEELRPARDLSRNPLFQIMLVLQNAPMKPLELPGLTLGPAPVNRGAAQLDLTLYVQEIDAGLNGFIEYATDLYDADRIARMARHLEQILRSAVEDPSARVSQLRMLTEDELAGVRSWNGTTKGWPPNCIHELIRGQAEQTPDRPALDFEGQTLSYARLEERASMVAGRLAALGVRPGSLVGVLMERSADMVAGVLGVLKAGGAYVPMDPTFPPDRLAYMLEDSGAGVLLTQESLSAMFETTARILSMDTPDMAGEVATPVEAVLDDVAYVIYTSGSTGKPKGVAITHRSLSNLLWSMKEEPGFGEGDALLAVTTLSFDIAALELYLPLLAGGRIVLANRDEVSDGRRLIDRLRSSGATVMQATPATWRLLLESGWQGEAGLKALCGGEALPRDLADPLLDRVGELWNVYGPTETTIWSSCERVRTERGPVSIGRPIANTTMYVLDGSGNLVPVGVEGELHIGGVGLARGYWNRPELTAERFIEDRVSGGRGRLYKTGDQARWLADGRLECLGRLDHQVKVRGYRIELEEIEVALRGHEGLEEAVVIAQQDSAGDQRLAAYLTQSAGVQPNVTELRNHLRKRLPAYMVPSSFVFLDRLPLTPNGKVDRKALAALGGGTAPRATATPPRTPMEKYVARLWGDALGVPGVGLQDNFFDLGGHSLLAMRVLAAIEKDTGTRLHPRDIIFQNLEQLARACGDRPIKRGVPAAAPTEPRAGRLRSALRAWIPGGSRVRQR